MDEIRYREYKILLKPEQFDAPSRFEDYWNALGKVAKACGVGVRMNKNPFHRFVRHILFHDTSHFDLYRSAFILRKRAYYEDGWPARDHELTVKYRHPDREKCTAIDMTPNLAGRADIKFKEEILPLKTALGGMRSLYSHNCVLTSPNIVLNQGLEDIVRVFPVMKVIDTRPEARLLVVNHAALDELLVQPGGFDFGHEFEAKATIALWRNRESETNIVGEFAFQAKFDHLDAIHNKAKARSEEFFREAQVQAPEWVALGTTKTAVVYGIGNTPVAHNE
jgi:hypothetical protein